MMTSEFPFDATKEEAAIRALIAEAEAHQNDVERFIPLHTQDAVIVNIAGIRLLGREALRQAMTSALQTRLVNVITRTEVLEVRFLSPDAAIVSCIKHVSDENADSGALPAQGSLTYVTVRLDGRWRIALAQTTPQTG